MWVQLYLNSISLEAYREGKELTTHCQYFPNCFNVHVDVHEEEVEIHSPGFAQIGGKGSD